MTMSSERTRRTGDDELEIAGAPSRSADGWCKGWRAAAALGSTVRLSGPRTSGSGYMLLPWARCVVWCARHRWPMLEPAWRTIRIGPYLRGERDKRRYHLLFRRGCYVHGMRRLFILARFAKAEELEASRVCELDRAVVVFRGLRDFFTPLTGWNVELRRELERIAKPELLDRQTSQVSFVGVHVRRGDFVDLGGVGSYQDQRNIRLPIEWYVAGIRALRQHVPSTLQFLVFSDGSDRELSPLLSEAAVRRYPNRNALSDLLVLASARVIIASGSSYSMWASFLGQAPTIWFPGQRRQFVTGNPSSEAEWEPPSGLPEGFQAALRDVLITQDLSGSGHK